jgi:DNA-directed RNA polymerase specialized sigma24 family protein
VIEEAVRSFVEEHRELILKRARAFVRAQGETVTVENVAREMELVVVQLASKGASFDEATAPEAYLRSIARFATGRARRRHKLVQQIAAGDDLRAMSEDLAALDGDLPPPPCAPSADAMRARDALEGVKSVLSARDALVFALWIEDDIDPAEIARTLSASEAEVRDACALIIERAREAGIAARGETPAWAVER